MISERGLIGTVGVTCAIVAFTLPLQAQTAPPESAMEMPVSVSAELKIRNADSATLIVNATIADGFHIYAQSQPKPFLATRIEVDPSDQFELSGPFEPAVEAHRRRNEDLDVEIHEFEHAVSWSAPVRLLDADSNALKLTGHVFAQACTADRCFAPQEYPFEARGVRIEVTTALDSTQDAVAIAATTAAAKSNTDQRSASSDIAAGFRLDDLNAQEGSAASSSLAVILPLALLAGLLLNFMPCVLPVVGLKVMSFVQQSGESRGRMFLLNLSYAAGLIGVMLVLASLAVFAGLGWGEQFSSAGFNITLSAIVFAFALSFLGVWEIPIPGLVGTLAVGGKAQSEGYTGAFFKGALSTVLATPCSGPFLGSALTWAVTQSAHLTYLVFAAVGVGMASPYLLIGLFPKLAGFLPKPGDWMATFKQLMGFVLLATVVYLMTFMPIPSVVPTALLLLGIGVACWRLGTVVITGSRTQKLRAWGEAALVTSLVAAVSFGWLEGLMAERFERAAQRFTGTPTTIARGAAEVGIAWEPFSRDRLESHIQEGKTVFVDFTADWCLTCKANEAVAIETAEVRELLRRNRIVALRADKTEPAPEVDEALRLLGNKAASIPFYAVFPARNPKKPITIDGVFSSPQPIIDALTTAGASQPIKSVVQADSDGRRERTNDTES